MLKIVIIDFPIEISSGEQSMRTCYIIRGRSGTGKSTLALQLVGEEKLIFEADKYPGLYDAEGKYNYELQADSHKWCIEQFKNALMDERSPIAVANTNLKTKYFQEYVDLALSYGYSVQIIATEEVILPDRKSAQSVHKIPSDVYIRQLGGYEAHIPRSPLAWHGQVDESRPTLRLLDRDGTLVFNPHGGIPRLTCNPYGGIPKLREMQLVEKVHDRLIDWCSNGDIIAIVSNQAGLVGNKHKTFEELHREAEFIDREITKTSPAKISVQIYCPDYSGAEVLLFRSGKWISVDPDLDFSPFRKPAPGMLELAMHLFAGKFGNVVFYGDSKEDEMAATAMNVSFTHIHKLIYG